MYAPKPLWHFTFYIDDQFIAEKYQRVSRRGLTRVMNGMYKKLHNPEISKDRQRVYGQYIEG